MAISGLFQGYLPAFREKLTRVPADLSCPGDACVCSLPRTMHEDTPANTNPGVIVIVIISVNIHTYIHTYIQYWVIGVMRMIPTQGYSSRRRGS